MDSAVGELAEGGAGADEVDGGEEGAFTAAGLPNLKVLSGKCGFQVAKDEMEAAWGEISAAAAGE